jgi:lipopolysaccharide transport system permease protein
VAAVTALEAPSSRRWKLDLLITLVERNFRLRAKRAWVGMVWPLFSPLLLLTLYVFVFKRIFDVPIEHYSEFLFAGLLPWSLLAGSLGATQGSLTTDPDVIRRSRFPYEFMPTAVVLMNTVWFLVTLTGFVGYLAIVGRLTWTMVPLLVLPTVSLVLLVMGFGALLSLIDVYSRDLRPILGNLLTVWFFLIPIVYRQEMAGEGLLFLRSIDPMNMIVGQFRDLLYYGHVSRPLHMALMVVVCTAFSLACRAVFRHWAPQLPRDI